MHTLDTHFRWMLNKIEPASERAEKARDLPAKLREYLQQSDDLKTVAPHTRLAGSYSRSTAIKDIKDVDVVVFVDSEYRSDIPGLLRTLKATLLGFPEYLDEPGEVKLRPQRRSVNVHLESDDFYMDVVPSLLPESKDTKDILEIPDREWLRWVKTRPLGYGDQLSKLNGEHAGKAVPLVKLMKHWRDMHFVNRAPKSYWLESIVYEYLYQGWVVTADQKYAPILADLFDATYDRFKQVQDEDDEQCPYLPDPALGNHIAFNWQRTHFDTFMRRLDENRKRAREAVTTEDRDTAVRRWKKVFGEEWFPDTDTVSGDAKSIGTAAGDGSLSIGRTGQVLEKAIPSIASVVAPATRFFGQD